MDRRTFLGRVGAVSTIALAGERAGATAGERGPRRDRGETGLLDRGQTGLLDRGETVALDPPKTDGDAGEWGLDWWAPHPEGFHDAVAAQVLVLGEYVVVASIPRPPMDRDDDPPRGRVVTVDRATGEGSLRAAPVGGTGVVRLGGALYVPEEDEGAVRTGGWRLDGDEWVALPDVEGELGGAPAAGDGSVILALSGELVALEPPSEGERAGSVAWRAPVDGTVTGAVTADGVVYATTDDGRLLALANGDRRWATPVAETGLAGPVVAGDSVVAVDEWGGAHAVATDGTLAWSTRPGETLAPGAYLNRFTDTPGTVGRVAATDTHCFVAAIHGPQDDEENRRTAVSALALADGSEAWTHDFQAAVGRRGGSVRGGPVVQPRVTGGTVWAVGRRGAAALDAATGELRRRWHLPNAAMAPPLPDDDTVYVADDWALYALDTAGTDCSPPEPDEHSVSYEVYRGDDVLEVIGGFGAGSCPALALVGLRVDGALLAVEGTLVRPGDGGRVFTRYPWPEMPRDVEEVRLVFRGTGGRVLGTVTPELNDYRDEPGDFALVCPSVSTANFGVGTIVDVTVDVVNYGFDEGYVLTLVADGEVVARESGSVGKRVADEPAGCETNPVPLSHAFYGFGSRDLELRVEPRADAGEGDTVDLDSVAVGNPGALGTLGGVGALGVGYLGWRAKRSDGRRRGRSRRER